jgi:hypothetical protein
MGVGGALTILVFAHNRFRVLPALDNFHDARGYVGADVVTNEYVGRFRVVDCQRILRDSGR